MLQRGASCHENHWRTFVILTPVCWPGKAQTGYNKPTHTRVPAVTTVNAAITAAAHQRHRFPIRWLVVVISILLQS